MVGQRCRLAVGGRDAGHTWPRGLHWRAAVSEWLGLPMAEEGGVAGLIFGAQLAGFQKINTLETES